MDNINNKRLLLDSIAKFRTANINRINYEGLTKAEYTYLIVINNIEKPVTSVTLKKFFDCSKAYVSKVVNILIEKGFVKMEKSADDGRAKYLTLTTRGSNFVKKYMDEYTSRVDYLYEQFGEEKSVEFAGLLVDAMKILKEYDHIYIKGEEK